jgi:hypothetical protein
MDGDSDGDILIMTWRGPTSPLSNTERDYGTKHQKARKAAARQHNPTDPCARCGHALGPMGPWLHYDHNDTRSGYLGFSHGTQPCPVCGKRCNIRAGASKGARIANQRRMAANRMVTPPNKTVTLDTSRRW